MQFLQGGRDTVFKMANRAGGSFIAGVRRAGTLLIVLGIFRGAQGLEVVTPSDGLIVVADR